MIFLFVLVLKIVIKIIILILILRERKKKFQPGVHQIMRQVPYWWCIIQWDGPDGPYTREGGQCNDSQNDEGYTK